jgi:adenylate kinase
MILIMGVAGAGKSKQGKILAEKLGYQWLSTGELLRRSVSGDAKQEMLKGKLLGDGELIRIMDKTLVSADQEHVILDGFPRTLPQAQWLLERHGKGIVNIDMVILLDVPKQAVKDRLLQRGRQDDNEQSINKRFEEHEKMTLPIINLYQQHGIRIEEIDAAKPIEEVTKSITDLFNAG